MFKKFKSLTNVIDKKKYLMKLHEVVSLVIILIFFIFAIVIGLVNTNFDYNNAPIWFDIIRYITLCSFLACEFVNTTERGYIDGYAACKDECAQKSE